MISYFNFTIFSSRPINPNTLIHSNTIIPWFPSQFVFFNARTRWSWTSHYIKNTTTLYDPYFDGLRYPKTKFISFDTFDFHFSIFEPEKSSFILSVWSQSALHDQTNNIEVIRTMVSKLWGVGEGVEQAEDIPPFVEKSGIYLNPDLCC